MEPGSNKAVGRRLKALRERAGFNQTEMAAELHIAKSTLHGYESGNRSLTIETVRRVRLRFGVTIDWLLFGDMRITGHDVMLEIGPQTNNGPPKKVRTAQT